jgi:hypothetical protein
MISLCKCFMHSQVNCRIFVGICQERHVNDTFLKKYGNMEEVILYYCVDSSLIVPNR